MLKKKSVITLALVACATLASLADYTRWDWNNNAQMYYATFVPSNYYQGEIYFNGPNVVWNGLTRYNVP
jgi:hypothetical protein